MSYMSSMVDGLAQHWNLLMGSESEDDTDEQPAVESLGELKSDELPVLDLCIFRHYLTICASGDPEHRLLWSRTKS